jgi:periplasmic protein CpxP/Spy
LHAAHENVVAQDAPLPEQSAKAWLTFYSGLSDPQKTIFSAALRPYLEEVAHHPARPFEPRTGL